MSRDFDGNSANYLQGAIQSITAYPFSLSFWANWDVTNSIECPISIASSTSADDSVRFYIRGNVETDPGRIEMYDNEVTQEFNENGQITSGWKHYCIVVTSSLFDLYIDGTKTGGTNATAFSAINGIDEMCVGNWQKTASFHAHAFNGLVAEVSLWGIEVSSTQASDLAAGKSPLDTVKFPTGPIDYWRLKGTASPEPNEIAGANSLSIVGTLAQGGSDPTVDDPPSATIEPVTGEIQLSGNSSSIVVLPTVGAIDLSGNSPSIQVSATVGAVDLAGNSPALEMRPTAGSIELSGSPPGAPAAAENAAIELSGNRPGIVLVSSTGQIELSSSAVPLWMSTATGAIDLAGLLLAETRTPLAGSLEISASPASVPVLPGSSQDQIEGGAPPLSLSPSTGSLKVDGVLASIASEAVSGQLELGSVLLGEVLTLEELRIMIGTIRGPTTDQIPLVGESQVLAGVPSLSLEVAPGELEDAGNSPSVIVQALTGSLQVDSLRPALLYRPDIGSIEVVGNDLDVEVADVIRRRVVYLTTTRSRVAIGTTKRSRKAVLVTVRKRGVLA